MTEPTPGTPTAAHAFGVPLRQCDVEIRGRFAHGIGCPPRVLELARTYRLRSIRGTSPGAVAAAVTAAAEYGRERGGFEKLGALNAWLMDGTHLRDLFQATRATRPLLRLCVSLRRRGRVGSAASGVAAIASRFWSLLPEWARIAFDVIPGALRDALPAHYWIATVLGGVVGGTLDVVIADALIKASHPHARTVVALVLPVMFIGCYLASFGACAWRLWRLLSVEVPRQGFGLCTGLAAAPPPAPPAFSEWLHQCIQDLAGLPATGPPLTLGMLRAKRAEGGSAEVGIELNLVATGPGLERSGVLPIQDELLLFREGEMRRFFPERVVDHLVEIARPAAPGHPFPAGYLALPEPMDMPVLVMVRMSTSIPLLLSAVPLYAAGQPGGEHSAGAPTVPATEAEPGGDVPRRAWFGGGPTSQLSIGILDAWLPSRPPFGFDLAGESSPGESARWAGTVAPGSGARPQPAAAGLASLPQFLAAIWRAARGIRDGGGAGPAGDRDHAVPAFTAAGEGDVLVFPRA